MLRLLPQAHSQQRSGKELDRLPPKLLVELMGIFLLDTMFV